MALTVETMNQLSAIAQIAYGQGEGDKITGGDGRIGMIDDHIVKFNTTLKERLIGPKADEAMLRCCNDLRARLIEIARSAIEDEGQIAKIYRKLGLKPDADPAACKDLLDRSVVAKVVNMIAGGASRDIWSMVDRVGKMSAAEVQAVLKNGFGPSFVAPKGGKSLSKEELARNAALACDAVDLFKSLAYNRAPGVPLECRIGGMFVQLTWNGPDSDVTAKVYGPKVEVVNLGASAKGLLARLADEICAHPDRFGNFFAQLLEVLPREPDAGGTTGPSLVRSFCERIIQNRAGVSADRLANATTANLLDIAKDVVALHGRVEGGLSSDRDFGEFGGSLARLHGTYSRLVDRNAETLERLGPGQAGGRKNAGARKVIDEDGFEIEPQVKKGKDDGFVVVTSERELVEARIAELEMVNARQYIASEDARALLEAMNADTAVEVKVTVPENFNLQKKYGVRLETDEQKLEAERVQALRDLAADLALAEDPSIHDANNIRPPKELLAVLESHADTLAKLMVACRADPVKAFNGLCDEATVSLKMLMRFLSVDVPSGDGDEPEMPRFEFKELDPGEFGADGDAGMLAENLRREFRGVSFPSINMFRLLAVKTAIDKGIRESMETVQNGLNREIDGVFADEVVQRAEELTTIDDMMKNAEKPGNAGYSVFVKTVLKRYFTGVDAVDKKAMVAAMFRYAPQNASDAERLAAMLKGAGPLMQKMLQGLDSKSLGDGNIGAAIKDMKKNLSPIPEKIVKANLHDLVVRSGGKLTNITAEKTLGCASVGQAILCRAYGPDLPAGGKEVVVKILRPDALQRIEREKKLILGIAEEARMKGTYESQLKSILQEFDFKREAANIDAGKVYEKRKAYPRTGAVMVENLVQTSTMTLMMQRAPGKTAEDVVEDAKRILADPNVSGAEIERACRDLRQMQKDLCDLAKIWVTEGLYGSGFFHGDLHGGNIMLDPEKGSTMIDFGNVTQLSRSEKENITKMMTSASLGWDPRKDDGRQANVVRDPKKERSYAAAAGVCVRNFMEGLEALLSQKAKDAFAKKRHEISTMLATVLTTGDVSDAGKRIFVALTEIQRMGVEIPGTIFKFSQSQMRIQNSIDSINGALVGFERSILARINSSMTKLGEIEKSVNDVMGGVGTKLNEAVKTCDLRDPDARSEFKASVKNLSAGYPKNSKAGRKEGNLYIKVMLQGMSAEDMVNIDDIGGDFFKVVRSVADEELDQLWQAVIDLKQKNGAQQDVDQAIQEFAQKFWDHVDRSTAEMFRKLLSEDFLPEKPPEDFFDCMGKVLKQNLTATTSRLPIELMNAVRNN